ncbi:MAG TPA: cell division protein FtsB [Pusillimonas sp.]|jgi:cell division protein FtsB|nr:cell division protein FtsB [Pusillimonas sp.]MBC40792.1 cell division protein FtsB [Pusillimonas sp.]HBT32412.1 cell division protein FtsB [Pusillimonas sp.]HCN71853.1 cell division protein FtsB [Pusillimonas sp.]HCP77899.1 cell division protein FtsB [Pusillimonas sp.]|tara:strand:- start:43 stop:330 length:288 start_codon:yes stop_codon:yes gene_type:complete
MRLLLLVLVILTLAIQYPLWWGKDSWSRVAELEARVAEQQAENEALTMRNNALAAEVHDLRSGTTAVEERARSELGMVKEGDVFVRILRADTPPR